MSHHLVVKATQSGAQHKPLYVPKDIWSQNELASISIMNTDICPVGQSLAT